MNDSTSPAEFEAGRREPPAADKVGGLTPRQAYGYLTVPRWGEHDVETRARRTLVEYAGLEGLELRSLFVDRLGEPPHGFAAMCGLLRCRGDVRAVLLPDLRHVAHVPAVAHLTRAGLARYLGAAVFVVDKVDVVGAAPAVARSSERS